MIEVRDSLSVTVNRTKNNEFKLKEGTFSLDIRKKFFAVKVGRP